MDVFACIRSDPLIAELARLIDAGAGAVAAEGLWGSAAPIAAAIVAERLGRPLLIITAHADEADELRDDVQAATGAAPELLPALDTSSHAAVADDELEAERLRLCLHAGRAAARPWVIAAPVLALMQPTPSPAFLANQCRTIVVGDSLDPDALAEWLAAHGFARCDAVETPGDFARRGGIIDVFGSAYVDPLRIEFFGDEVASLRLFTPGAQRSTQELARAEIPALRISESRIASRDAGAEPDVNPEIRTPTAREGPIKGPTAREGAWRWESSPSSSALPRGRAWDGRRAAAGGDGPLPGGRASERPLPRGRGSEGGSDATSSFFAHLPANVLVALYEPNDIQEIGRTYMLRLGERAGVIPPEAVFRRANQFTQLHLNRFQGVLPDAVRFDVSSLPQLDAKHEDPLAPLAEISADCDVVVLCDNEAEQERFAELLAASDHAGVNARGAARGDSGVDAHGDAPPRTTAADAPLRDAAAARSPKSAARVPVADTTPPPATPRTARHDLARPIRTAIGVIRRGFRWRTTAFVAHHELFHRYRQRRTLRRVAPARPIDTFLDLDAGDAVVHVVHGIGRFLGLKSIEREDRVDEYLAIEFAGGAVVNVPVSQIHVVQKYIGSAKGKPKLSALGGSGWKRTKERVAEAVSDMAAELLAIQARRASEPGVAYPADTRWQHEFEGAFIYPETEDQLRAIAEIKSDMQRPRPMDRLLCGDVGYGKTEVAIRAAFKAAEYGKQVAVLAPTTVLAEQHLQTFRERLADYPMQIEGLSRFRKPAEQRRIVERARAGEVDILIGTHRILSRDVRFADLGLVIIDEEQRFGVEAKERLKHYRATVDVLTLSATPIPRTLHLSMLGVRDISSLQSAPLDRRAIVTQVRMWEDALIREGIVRELNRDGQVYFVHNFVRDIHQIANHIRTLVPEARLVVGHGQMDADELEDAMLTFLNRDADVLVSTNIIESGLDVPTANTIFINRADRFGLADLHQLRGRVGRARHRAFAYLLLSPKHPLKENAARRLKAIEHYSELGAGFQIAMRDLEIRGAGNILGAEQSGHIEAVGYEMYCQLLDEAVRRMKHEPAALNKPVNLDLGVSASIPRAYIRADKQRMDVYKRLTQCRVPADLETLRRDLRDAFGPPPPAVETLLDLAEIRVLAAPWSVRAIVLKEPDLIFSLDDVKRADELFRDGPGSPRMPDPQTIHWRLPKRYLEPATMLALLRKQLGRR